MKIMSPWTNNPPIITDNRNRFAQWKNLVNLVYCFISLADEQSHVDPFSLSISFPQLETRSYHDRRATNVGVKFLKTKKGNSVFHRDPYSRTNTFLPVGRSCVSSKDLAITIGKALTRNLEIMNFWITLLDEPFTKSEDSVSDSSTFLWMSRQRSDINLIEISNFAF